MLHKILSEFKGSSSELCLEEVAARIGVEPSAAEGMINFLIRKGKLVEISRCVACADRGMCRVVEMETRSFILASRNP